MKFSKFIIIFNVLVLQFAFAQKSKIEEAKKYYEKQAYMKSIKTLEELIKNGNKSSEVFQSLANAYYFNGKMEKASEAYKELMNKKKSMDFEIYFRYSQALKSQEKYSESDAVMKKFVKLNPNDSRAKSYRESQDYLNRIDKASEDFKLKNLEINTKNSDFGVAFYENAIYFTSARGSGKKYSWNDQPFLNIYKKEDDSLGVQEVGGDVNTKYHESSACFTKDGQTMYFTRNNYYKGRFKKNSKNEHNLKIYKATLIEGKWRNIEPLPFNDEEYNVAHPALNKEGTKLYFSSDMPGTLGGSDIFVVPIFLDGSYGEPRNLGPKINTEGRENFPFISDSGVLYFSSDSHLGLGGLDVFEFQNIDEIERSSANSRVYNVGRPINSPRDDFGYIINEVTRVGYVASNRPGGRGDDDIYTFKRKPKRRIPLGAELTEYLTVKPVYFDYDKYDIRVDAEIELAKIIDFMLMSPRIHIRIDSYTDSRGRKEYNMVLSQKRNEAIMAYLNTVGGIELSRLSIRNFGESQLTNKCADGVKCTEEEHQMNRRSRFVVVSN